MKKALGFGAEGWMTSERGAPGWDRTSNPCLRRAVLYPLSYGRNAMAF
jgi:hypothetical protein